jgi:hypothetical protein
MAGTWPIWRDAFLQRIQPPGLGDSLKAAALAADLRSWTANLTTAVVQSCERLGWIAAGKWNERCRRLPQPGHEFLGLDVTAFTPGPTPLWPFPLAVFELENSQEDRRVAYSLWKVLCVRASLRVVFAYRRDWEQSRHLVGRLTDDVIGGVQPEERQALEGETVIAVGNRGEGETFPWGYFKFWMLNPNLGRFEKI